MKVPQHVTIDFKLLCIWNGHLSECFSLIQIYPAAFLSVISHTFILFKLYNSPSNMFISRNCVKASKKNPTASEMLWQANDFPCKSLSSGTKRYNEAVTNKHWNWIDNKNMREMFTFPFGFHSPPFVVVWFGKGEVCQFSSFFLHRMTLKVFSSELMPL